MAEESRTLLYGATTATKELQNVVSALQQKVASLESTLNSLASGTAADYVVDYKINADGSWYRRYKSGWVEQGGFVVTPSSYENFVNFLVPFKDLPAQCYVTYLGTIEANYANDDANMAFRDVFPEEVSSTRFCIYGYGFGNSNAHYKGRYYACGQGA